MTSNILVAVDGSKHSERALKTTIDLAAKLDSQLIIANVFEDYGNAARVWKKRVSAEPVFVVS